MMLNFIHKYFQNKHCAINRHNTEPLRKKIIEELMPVAWHPTRWWNFGMSEDEKK